MDATTQDQHEIHRVKRGRPAKAVDIASQDAQAYARRIWEGQSPDLPRAERLKRVADGLAAQGMSMDGIAL